MEKSCSNLNGICPTWVERYRLFQTRSQGRESMPGNYTLTVTRDPITRMVKVTLERDGVVFSTEVDEVKFVRPEQRAGIIDYLKTLHEKLTEEFSIDLTP
jgi:hypothetical protein